MPALSRLHTAFFPSQQSCEALTLYVPPSGSENGAPQMFPTGLQACPLSQRPYVSPVYFSHTTLPFGFEPPPQHSCSLIHVEPVIWHPEEGWHTFTPLPRSVQLRVQQLELPEQGIPFWLQPPDGRMQYPTVPSFLLQILLQQSRSLSQISLLAWHPDAATHIPPWQFVEQHSRPEPHACPRTLHGFGWSTMVAHLPPEQLPVQQLPLDEQTPPTSTH
jgi:hypothetical protein